MKVSYFAGVCPERAVRRSKRMEVTDITDLTYITSAGQRQ